MVRRQWVQVGGSDGSGEGLGMERKGDSVKSVVAASQCVVEIRARPLDGRMLSSTPRGVGDGVEERRRAVSVRRVGGGRARNMMEVWGGGGDPVRREMSYPNVPYTAITDALDD